MIPLPGRVSRHRVVVFIPVNGEPDSMAHRTVLGTRDVVAIVMGRVLDSSELFTDLKRRESKTGFMTMANCMIFNTNYKESL